MLLSLVIPVLNEAESLQPLFREIDEVARQAGYDIEIIFVDDGSTDGSWEIIQKLADADARVQGIKFRRNFGKAAALSAGFRASQGDFIVTLDADLQDDPHEIPRFLETLADEYDLVSGWKQVRHDPQHKVVSSHVFNWMVSTLTGVHLHDHNCGMKCYRREAVRDLKLYGEMHRFLPVLAAAKGYRVGEMVIHHRQRRFGQSKYGLGRIVRGFFDLFTVKFLTTYGQRPMHLLGSCGAILIVVALLAALISWHAAAIAALIIGVQLLVSGLLAELLVAQRAGSQETYSIDRQTNHSVELYGQR
jgi:glycosyltransferase involved in cell wall biosynthesis